MGFSLCDGDNTEQRDGPEWTGPMLVFVVGLQSRGPGLGMRARIILRRWFRSPEQAMEFHAQHAGMLPPAGYTACLGMTVACERIPPGNAELERICESMVND